MQLNLFFRLSRLLLSFFLLVMFSNEVIYSQQGSSIETSVLFGGTNTDNIVSNYSMVRENGFTYIGGRTNSTDLLVTNSSSLQGSYDMFFAKLDNDGTIIYSTYIGGVGATGTPYFDVKDGYVYFVTNLVGNTFPVTDASSNSGSSDLVYGKLDSVGSIVYAKYFGGSSNESLSFAFAPFKIMNGKAYLILQYASSGLPVTTSSTLTSGHYLFNFNLGTGSLVDGTYIEAGELSYSMKGLMKDGEFYFVHSNLVGGTLSVTNSSVYAGGNTDLHVSRFDKSLNLKFASYYGGSNNDGFVGNRVLQTYLTIDVLNKESYIYFSTKSQDFPVTDLSTFNSVQHLTGATVGILMRLDSNGNKKYATYRPAYIGAYTRNLITLTVENQEVYLMGPSILTSFPSTNGSSGVYSVAKYNDLGQLVYNTRFGSNTGYYSDAMSKMVVENGQVHTVSNSSGGSGVVPTTGGFDKPAGANAQDVFAIKLSQGGDIAYASFLGGIIGGSNYNGLRSIDFRYENNSYYMLNSVPGQYRLGYPVTTGSNLRAGTDLDIGITRIDLCPEGYDTVGDTLTPRIQEVCQNGFVTQIKGRKIVLPSDSLPLIDRDGVFVHQPEIAAGSYQWQIASSASGPWSNIGGAVLQNYTPSPTTTDKYFRRIALMSECCDHKPIDTSSVAKVQVSLNTAPTVDAGGVFNTCPGVNVTIGGSPSATGGTTPYAYHWDNILTTDSAIANPSITNSSTAIYTLTVEDALGCIQKAQALVNVYSANAGADVSSCAGDSVRLLGQVIPGIGATYSWSPGTELNSTTVSQPKSLPSVPRTYTLTLTIPVTGGGTCSTTDVTIATPVTGPRANFGGVDHTICLGSTASLGTPSQSGFTYTWTPPNYLSNRITAQTTYNPGSLRFPTPDSGIYTVTAYKDGCYFTDDVTVFVINADAGPDVCPPAIIGNIGRTDHPNLNETFSWVKLSGPGNIIGPTTGPTAVTSATSHGATYQLTTTLNGVSCTDIVYVDTNACIPILGGVGCGIKFSTDNCPSTKHGPVKIRAYPSNGSSKNYTYSWSPMVGLSSYSTDTVSLTDTVYRIYTVTMRSLLDTTVWCTKQIEVNTTAMKTLPVFEALDTTVCSGTVVGIGNSNNPYYEYEWTPSTDLSYDTVSNPQYTANSSRTYYVKVTDTLSGCHIRDTSEIEVRDVHVNAGGDYTFCGPTTIVLGSSATPHTIYSWVPGTANYQNGTDSSSAKPEVLVAVTSQYIVTATDTVTGCSAKDTVDVTYIPIPTIPNFPDTFICYGTGKQIGSPGQKGITYSWSPVTGLSNSTAAQPIANPTSTTIYTVTATFPGGCTATDNVTVTVHDPRFTLTDINYCPSNGPVDLGTTAPGGMTNYSWFPASQVTNSSIPNPSTLNPPPSSVTTYNLRVIDANGCRWTDGIIITPTIVTPIAGSNTTVCLNTTTTIGSALNGTGPNINYSWSPATGLSSATDPNPTFTPSGTGTFTYVLTKTNTTLPCSAVDSITITVKDFTLPVMSSSSICQNSSVAIGSSPQAGARYYWSPGSTLSDSTISNPVASPTTTTAYHVNAIGANGCTASGTVIIGVNPSPSPQITLIDTLTICQGIPSVQFHPGVTPIGGSLNYLWSPNDGSVDSIYVLNPTITVGGTGYKAYTLLVTDTFGCSNEDSVVLEVKPESIPNPSDAGFDQNLCEDADSTQLSANLATTGIGKWEQASGPNILTIVDSSLNATKVKGLQKGVYEFVWSIKSEPCGLYTTTDTVEITIDSTPIARAGADQEDCITSTINLNATPVGGKERGAWVQLSGSNTATITDTTLATTGLSGLTDGTYTFEWTVTNTICPVDRDTVELILHPLPTANAGVDTNLCAPGTYILTGNLPRATETGVWTQLTGPTPLTHTNATSNTDTIGNLQHGIYTLEWKVDNAYCDSATDTVEITIDSMPIARAGANQQICLTSSAVLNATPVFGKERGEWVQITGPNTATLADSALAASSVSGLIVGIYTFEWVVTNGVCSPDRDTVEILVQNILSSDAGSDTVICIPSAFTLYGNIPSSTEIGTWRQLSGPSNLIFSDSNLYNSIISNTQHGTYTLEWKITNGICDSATDTVEITIDSMPIARAGADQEECITAPINLNATAVGGKERGAWIQLSGPTTATISDTTLSTTGLSGLTDGTYTFEWTVTNTICPVDRDTVELILHPLPTASAGADTNLCSPGSYSLIGNLPRITETGVWTQLTGPTTLTHTNTASNTNTIGNLQHGVYMLEWKVDNAYCDSATDTVEITIDSMPIARAGADQEECITSTINLNATPVGGKERGAWVQLSGPTTATISDTTLATTGVTGLTDGTYTFEWTVTNTICPVDRDTVELTLHPLPTADAGADTNLCSPGSYSLIGNLPRITETGVWTQLTGPTTLTHTNTASNTNTIGNLQHGVYTLEWKVDNAYCDSATDILEITIDSMPIARAGANQEECITSTINLNATPVGGKERGAWVQLSGPNTTTITDTTLATTGLSGLTDGTYTFEWTVTNTICPVDRDTVELTLHPLPTASAGADTNLCAPGTYILTGNLPRATETGVWTQLTGPTTLTHTNTVSNTNTIGNLQHGVYTLEWKVDNAFCDSTTDTVEITIDSMPIARAGANQEECITSTINLNATPVGGKERGAWVQLSGPNTTTITDTTLATTGLSGLTDGTYTFEWTVTNTICPVDRDTVELRIHALPQANAGADINSCTTGSLSLTGNIPRPTEIGTWTNLPINPTVVTFSIDTIPTPSLANLGIGTYYFVWTVRSNYCDSAQDTVRLQIDSISDPNAGLDDTLCENQPYNLSGSVLGILESGVWTQIDTNTSIVFGNTTSPISSISGLNPGTYSFRWRVSNGLCPGKSDTVNITLYEQPTADAGPNQQYCDTSSTTLSSRHIHANTYHSYTWSYDPANSTVTTLPILGTPNSQATTISGLSPGVYSFVLTVSNSHCAPSYDTVEVSIRANPRTDFSVLDPEVCLNECHDFTNLSTISDPQGSTITSYGWSFGDGGTSLTEDPIHCYAQIGSYDVTLIAMSDFGCIDTATKLGYVTVQPLPMAGFDMNPLEIYPNDQLKITDKSIGAISYDYSLGNGTTSTQANPITNYPTSGTYTIEQIVINTFGCRDTTVQTLIVIDRTTVYLPNAFTPNADGQNDIFLPVAMNIDTSNYNLMVFNRWGEKIFQTNEIGEGWDGTHQEEPVQLGAYVWVLRYKGRESNETLVKRGHVSVVR